ncbi:MULTISPECIES: hypothetical protein [unclassified Acinetobacter]|uniref:hypothetical protein n=1 Tax=unclassified Acinetobacter TaxID=196816 RepID=UPI001039F77B|nr:MULTISPECIES: hypothetical protein [unclassified Acinetobacter]TCB11851.1 hypothetical protein E0H78_05970 [Acinetobacter sp. ANC 4641]TCB26308.1 hypothetical protein E0H77_06420 [Acinetobacter sp. ANC 4633]
MKKIKQALWLSLCLAPGLSFAAETQSVITTAQTIVQGNTTMVVSPRTGIRYALGDTQGRLIQIQTTAIAPANTLTVKRIVATNPALSVESQQKAEQSLLSMEQSK